MNPSLQHNGATLAAYAAALLRVLPRKFTSAIVLVLWFATNTWAQTTVVDFGQVWKFQIPVVDPGTSWRGLIYDDNTWSAGPGLLGYETATLPAPGLRTSVGSSSLTQPVYLFRSKFAFEGDPAGAAFSIDQIVDDGVTYYLNGTLLGSSRHIPGVWNNLSNGSVGDAALETNALSGYAPSLVYGENVLAAEVHQTSATNSDLVFGARLKITSAPLATSRWRTLHFGAPDNTGNAADLADPDGDGLQNIEEYTLCTNPNKPNSWGVIAVTGGNLTITYYRRKAALNEMDAFAEISTQLGGTWSSQGVTEQVILDNGLVETVVASTPVGATSKFIRVKVVRRPMQPAPSAPSGMTASATSMSTIALTWVDNSSNETGFKLERRQSGTSNFVHIASLPPNTNSYVDSGLTVGTKYYYRILATVADSDSVFCPEANATTHPAIPFAPANPAATTISTSSIRVTWSDQSSNETAFKVERRQSGTADFVLVATTGAGVTEFQDSGLFPGTRYYYHIRASNAAGESANTADVSAVTTNAIPASPSNVVATANSSTQITVSWSDNSTNETEFRIERKTGSTGSYVEIGTVTTNIVSYQDSNLTPATTYFYRLRSTNSLGHSGYSNEASATTANVAPTAPTGLIATANSSSQIHISWNDNSGNESGFKIERKTGSAGTYAQVATVGANVVDYLDSSLTAGTTYYYRVCATNAVGDSARSNEVATTTYPPAGQAVTPAILMQGYDEDLKLQITGSSGNWLISDVSTKQLQSGYEWWYFVGGKLVKTSSNLTNAPWKGNHPGRVVKIGAKIGLDTLNRWDLNAPVGGGYYDPHAGMYFDRGDTGSVVTFMFR